MKNKFKKMTLTQLLAFSGEGQLSKITQAQREQYWAARLTARLAGKQVSHVTLGKLEHWGSKAAEIHFTDGATLLLTRDDEGNYAGAGSLLEKDGTEEIFCVV